MKPLDDCRLYAFVDTAYLSGRAPEKLSRSNFAMAAQI